MRVSVEPLSQLLRSVSLTNVRDVRRFVTVAEPAAHPPLALRGRPSNADISVVSEYLDLVPFPFQELLPLVASYSVHSGDRCFDQATGA